MDIPKKVISILELLKQDNYLSIVKIIKINNKIKLDLKLSYPFVSTQMNNRIEINDLLNEYHSVNNVISSTSLLFNDINTSQTIKVVEPINVNKVIILKEKKKKIKQKVIKILPKVQFTLIGSKKTAIINSKIVNIGDIIDNYKIIDISADSVLVEDEKDRRWLKVSN